MLCLLTPSPHSLHSSGNTWHTAHQAWRMQEPLTARAVESSLTCFMSTHVPPLQPPDQLQLWKEEVVLEDAKKLADLKVENDDVLTLCHALPGGGECCGWCMGVWIAGVKH